MKTPVLLAALILFIAVPMAVAEVDPATLHNLAKQALIQAQIQADPSESKLQELLREGSKHVVSILNTTDSDESKEYFLAAMQMFSEAFDIINQNLPDVDNGSPYYDSILERAIKYYGHLLELADTYDVEMPIDDMEVLFETAASQINVGDPGVANTLMDINSELGLLREQIGAIAVEEDRERALKYAALYIKHLERMAADATELNIPPEGVEVILAIRDRLAGATEPSDIISIINEVIDIKHELDLVKVNQLELWMEEIQGISERMYQDGELDDIEYAAVKATLGRFLDEMDNNDLDEAEIILNRLDKWLMNK